MKLLDLVDFIVLNIGHAKTVHAWSSKDISSPFVRLYYVNSGNAVLHLHDKDFHLTEGHLYMIPSYTPHSYECSPEFDFYYLFVFQRLQNQINVFDVYNFPAEVTPSEGTKILLDYYCKYFPELFLPTKTAQDFDRHTSYKNYALKYAKLSDYKRIQLHGLVEILFSYFLKYAEQKAVVNDKRLAQLIKYIQEHIHEPITIDQLAKQAHLTNSYLIRNFKQWTGCTPLQYIIRKKIQYAQMLLLSTDQNINEISKNVGFQDVSYFIRLFKKSIDFTPQEYRENLIG